MLVYMKMSGGFTLIEILVTVTIMGILAAITISIPWYVTPRAHDSERGDDMASLARRLEQAYNAQEVGSPAYPSTDRLLSDISGNTGTVSRLSADVFKVPGALSSSVVAASSNTDVTPTSDQYVYQPLTSSGSLCTGSATCVRFIIYYLLEYDNSKQTITSMHQQ